MLLLLYLFILIISVLFYIFSFKAKRKLFIFLCICYFLISFFLFDGAVHLHQYLRDKGIYIELGHAEELLVVSFFLWIIIALINIIIVAIIKSKKRKW